MSSSTAELPSLTHSAWLSRILISSHAHMHKNHKEIHTLVAVELALLVETSKEAKHIHTKDILIIFFPYSLVN